MIIPTCAGNCVYFFPLVNICILLLHKWGIDKRSASAAMHYRHTFAEHSHTATQSLVFFSAVASISSYQTHCYSCGRVYNGIYMRTCSFTKLYTCMILRPNFTYVHFFIFFLYRYPYMHLVLLSPTMHFLEPLCQFMILIF